MITAEQVKVYIETALPREHVVVEGQWTVSRKKYGATASVGL